MYPGPKLRPLGGELQLSNLLEAWFLAWRAQAFSRTRGLLTTYSSSAMIVLPWWLVCAGERGVVGAGDNKRKR